MPGRKYRPRPRRAAFSSCRRRSRCSGRSDRITDASGRIYSSHWKGAARLMISTIVKINFLNLRRDRAAFGLTFVLPIIFFSIFAMIFGRMDREARDNTIKVAVADRDQSEM